jgi:hypothetical protein
MDQQLCRGCGRELPTIRPLKKFCKYACRGQFRALRAMGERTGLRGSKNLKGNRALQTLKRQSRGAITFARINSCTFRVDRIGKSAVGWLMEVAWPGGSRQRWVARVGDRASEPLPFDAAKQAAIAFLREKGKPRDAELNQIAANEVDRAVLQRERRTWPLNIMGGQRRTPCMTIEPGLRETILEVELGGARDE